MVERFDPKLIGSITFLPDADGEWVKASDYDALANELARVKAESLRVVKVGEPCLSWEAHSKDNFVLLEDMVCVADYTTYGWVQIDGFVANIGSEDLVQPVRLERWETSE